MIRVHYLNWTEKYDSDIRLNDATLIPYTARTKEHASTKPKKRKFAAVIHPATDLVDPSESVLPPVEVFNVVAKNTLFGTDLLPRSGRAGRASMSPIKTVKIPSGRAHLVEDSTISSIELSTGTIDDGSDLGTDATVDGMLGFPSSSGDVLDKKIPKEMNGREYGTGDFQKIFS